MKAVLSASSSSSVGPGMWPPKMVAFEHRRCRPKVKSGPKTAGIAFAFAIKGEPEKINVTLIDHMVCSS
jgi:hypothetical protein